MKYGNATLGQVEAVWNKLGGEEGVKRFLSGELMVQAKKAIGYVFRFLVNYDLKVEALVREGKYDWANGNITSKNFLTKRTGQHEVETKLFDFNRNISSEEVIAEMKKEGYRPAEAHETLTYGIKNPDEQRKYPIVGLGSVWQHWDGHSRVVCLLEDYGKREAILDYFDNGWSAGYRFLAVRES